MTKKLGFIISVTKQTQAREGLRYTLEARRVSPEVVMVTMEIPREGKLKDVRSATMSIRPNLPPSSGPVSYSPLVSALLQTTEDKKGVWTVSFQLAPELAERCSVDLLIPRGPVRDYFYYAVELKGYITDASSR